jgi:hypothetical protein
MTLKTNWGNDVLNAYAEQINDLEAQGSRTGAPAKYGKDLENWFNQLVKETRDSSGGKSTSGSSSAAGDGGTTEGGGTPRSGKAGSSGGKAGSSGGTTEGGAPAGSGATPGSSGGSGPPPSVDSSIQQISNIAGPSAAQTVSGLAGQGSALAGGGTGGATVGQAIAEAGKYGAERAGDTGADRRAAAEQSARSAESAVQDIKKAGGDVFDMHAAAQAVDEAAQFGGASESGL